MWEAWDIGKNAGSTRKVGISMISSNKIAGHSKNSRGTGQFQEARESNRNGWNRTDWKRNRKNWSPRTGTETDTENGTEIHEPEQEPTFRILMFFQVLFHLVFF